MNEDQLNDQEWAEAQHNHELLKNAVAKHGPEKIKQVAKEAVRRPTK